MDSHESIRCEGCGTDNEVVREPVSNAPFRLGTFYDDDEVHQFLLTVSAGRAYLLDYSSPMDMPLAEARGTTNDEAVRALFDRVTIPMGPTYCEDYPCCGHTPNDPCNYTGPTAEDMLSNPDAYHLNCEHEAGYCYLDEEEDEDE
jgi:hypothetical protein